MGVKEDELGSHVGRSGLLIVELNEGVSNVVLLVSVTKDLAHGVCELLEAHGETAVSAQGSAIVDDVVRQSLVEAVVLLRIEKIGQKGLGLVDRLVRIGLGAKCGAERGRDEEEGSSSGTHDVD